MRVVVETRSGALRGARERGLTVFRGIPFARPPVGERRFRAPEPPAPWAGVREATKYGPWCPQLHVPLPMLPAWRLEGETSEDCLYLNLWTPGADGRRRPVMVYIHGGGFTSGSGSASFEDPTRLCERGDVVVVKLNYRLGAFGYLQLADLCGGRADATPNAGVLDQIAALRWVRENVEAFGGDPDAVTVFGGSAGGMSVGTLLGTPAARGLFRGAIAESGAAHAIQSRADATRVAESFLANLGVDPAHPEALLQIPPERILTAQTLTALRFIAASGYSMRPNSYGAPMFAWCPSVDDELLPRRPLETIETGSAAGVPLLVGTTRDEWRTLALMDGGLGTLDDAGVLARCEDCIPGASRDGRSHGSRLLDAYRRARGGSADVSPAELWLAIETDRMMRIPAIRLAETQCRHEPRVFAYLFTWESPYGDLRAAHGIHAPFVFGTTSLPGVAPFTGSGPDADALSVRVQDAWLAFARGGNPNHPGLPVWESYEPGRRATMLLGRSCGLEHAPMDAERAAWDGLL